MLRIIGSYLCLGRKGLFCECDPFPLGKSFELKAWGAEVSALLDGGKKMVERFGRVRFSKREGVAVTKYIVNKALKR